jgi:protein-L-isoaspartate(D-aspartate) O-methyltransferase
MSLNDSRTNMIKQQLRTNNIHQDNILSLFETYSRAAFVPSESKAFAYADTHISLGHEQIMLTPLEEAKIIQSAKLKPSDRVLEIGSGSGFLAALLSQFCEEVLSIDYHPDFVRLSQENLSKHEIKNVTVQHQDAMHLSGLNQHFDVIICSSAIEAIPEAWIKCLKAKGKIFAPIGLDKIQNAQWIYFNHGQAQGHEFVFSSNLPPIINPAQREHFKF